MGGGPDIFLPRSRRAGLSDSRPIERQPLAQAAIGTARGNRDAGPGHHCGHDRRPRARAGLTRHPVGPTHRASSRQPARAAHREAGQAAREGPRPAGERRREARAAEGWRRDRRPRRRHRVRVPAVEKTDKSSRSSRSSATRAPAGWDARPARCTTRSPSRPGEGQLHDLGPGLRQGLLRRPVQRLRRVHQELLRGPVRRPVQRRRDDDRLGARSPATPRRTATTPSRTSAARGTSSTTPPTRGTPRRSRPASRTSRSRPTSPPFDVWDRYDFDGDGNFNEPDGYLDHFQAVHAGEGEERGGAGPGRHLVAPLVRQRRPLRHHRPAVGGEQTSTAAPRSATRSFWSATTRSSPRTAAWACSRTSSATTSACPDYYDTAGGENGTGFWTLMSSGSWLGHGEAADEGIGTTPGLHGPGGEALPRLARLHRGGRRRERHLHPEPVAETPSRARTRPSRSTCPTPSSTDEYATPPAGTTPGGPAAVTT